MPGAPRYQSYIDDESSIRFVFKTDDAEPDMLHIYARHLTTPDDAIETFFSGQARWNASQERFETLSPTHGLYWFWIERDRVVMVISCFRREEV